MSASYAVFCAAYENWQADCLAEWNERHGDNRRFACVPDGDYMPGEVVEFSEGGDAYPHGCGGTGHVARAVTPWASSVHFVA